MVSEATASTALIPEDRTRKLSRSIPRKSCCSLGRSDDFLIPWYPLSTAFYLHCCSGIELHVILSLYIHNLPWCYYNLHVFFFSRFVESRNYKIQIVAHVGRKSAVVPSGTMEASYSHFFIGRGFESRRALLENVEPGTLILIGLRSPREWKNRTRLDEGYFFYYLIPPEDDF